MKPHHILIVDDNEQNLYLLRALLRGHDYEVVEARHGAEALEKARQNPPDLVITDILMPVMDGFTLCREWKKDEHLRTIPFIFYTATYTDDRDRQLALNLGADCFIIKPEEPDVFLAMIKETVLRVESEAAARGRSPEPATPELLAEEESVLLKQYSEALIRKLEAKMEELEQANRALQQEIVERKQTEQESVRIAREWETTFNATHDAIWIIDKDYRIQRANETAAKVFQRPRDNLLGNRCWEIVHGTEWPVPECPCVRAEISRQREMLEMRTDDRFLQVTVDPLFDATGQFNGAVHIISDITDRKRAELSLMASQKRFEDVALSSGDWIWEVDAEGRYIYASGRVEQILGYTPVELIGKTPFELMPEEEARRVEKIFGRIAARGEPIVDLENWNLSKTGERVCLLTNGVPLVDSEGNLLGYRGVDKDITERKRAEEALRQQDSFRNTIIRRMAEGLCVCHQISEYPYVRFTVWNDRMTKITGYTMEEINRLGWYQMMYPDPEVQKRAIERMARMRKGDDLGDEEWVITRADGEKRILSISTGILDTDTEEVHVLATMHDITERKRAEEALRQSQQLADLAISGSNGGVWDLEMDPLRPDFIPDAILLSPRLKGFIGFADDEFPNSVQAWQSRILPEDRQLVRQTAQDHLAGRIGLHECRYRIRHKDGSIRWIHSRGRILRDPEGRPLRWSGIDWDITPLKQAEEEQEMARERLVQAQRLEAVGRLAGGVAHDFNNMLNVILGYTELAMGKLKPSDPLYADLEEIHRAGTVSAEIIRQLLAFARKQPIAPRLLDLNATVEGMLNMLRRLIGENVNLAWIPHAGVWPVKMDPGQIDQILVNLCANAKDAIGDTGTITIETKNVTFDEDYCATHPGMEPGDFVLLAVSDDGCGMDETTLASIFEPFFTTRDAAEHSGLGLASVYGIVRQNKGFINVYSEPDKGAMFKIYIPRHAGEVKPSPARADAAMPLGHGETILIAENETAILEMTRLMLQQLGYTAIAASSPREALRLAETHAGAIDLLLTDVIMPEMNGRELSDQLHDRYPDVKTLFMSGYSDNVITLRGALKEGVHFIQKPFSIKDLAYKVREALGE